MESFTRSLAFIQMPVPFSRPAKPGIVPNVLWGMLHISNASQEVTPSRYIPIRSKVSNGTIERGYTCFQHANVVREAVNLRPNAYSFQFFKILGTG